MEITGVSRQRKRMLYSYMELYASSYRSYWCYYLPIYLKPPFPVYAVPSYEKMQLLPENITKHFQVLKCIFGLW